MSVKKLKLKILTIIAFIICTSLISIPTGVALAPSDMKLTYEFQSQTLTVNVTHVGQNKNDYIQIIEIFKNDVSVLNRTYTNQTEARGVLDTFDVTAVIGDNLTVTATCSKAYSITRWLVITSTTTTNTSSAETTSTTTANETSTTEPTNTTNALDTPMNTGPVLAIVVGLLIFFILFFLWLKPEYAPDALKKLGTRIRAGLSLLTEKLREIGVWIKTGFTSLLQQLKIKLISK